MQRIAFFSPITYMFGSHSRVTAKAGPVNCLQSGVDSVMVNIRLSVCSEIRERPGNSETGLAAACAGSKHARACVLHTQEVCTCRSGMSYPYMPYRNNNKPRAHMIPHDPGDCAPRINFGAIWPWPWPYPTAVRIMSSSINKAGIILYGYGDAGQRKMRPRPDQAAGHATPSII